MLQGKITLLKKCSSGIKTSQQNPEQAQKSDPLVYKDASDDELDGLGSESEDEFEVYEPGVKKRQRTTTHADDEE